MWDEIKEEAFNTAYNTPKSAVSRNKALAEFFHVLRGVLYAYNKQLSSLWHYFSN